MAKDFIVKTKINEKLFKKIGVEASERVAKAIVVDALAIANHTAPFESGNLASSHYIEASGNSITLGNNAEYSGLVHAMPQSMIQNGKRAQWLTRALEEAQAKSGVKFKNSKSEL